jgi:hypothetical protein
MQRIAKCIRSCGLSTSIFVQHVVDNPSPWTERCSNSTLMRLEQLAVLRKSCGKALSAQQIQVLPPKLLHEIRALTPATHTIMHV